jgi:hypothetical protein
MEHIEVCGIEDKNLLKMIHFILTNNCITNTHYKLVSQIATMKQTTNYKTLIGGINEKAHWQ